MLDIIQLNRLDVFYKEIKKEALLCFVTSYRDSTDFIKTYKDSFLPLEEIEFECRKYIIIDNNGLYSILRKDYDKMVLRVYKNLVCKVLNKQVDEGVLELCWDTTNCDFMWRKKRKSKK